MANNSIQVGQNTPFGRDIAGGIDKIHEGRDQINEVLAKMTQALDGDPGQEASYATIKIKGGFESDAKAKAGYDELSSLAFKLNSNAANTDVAAAVTQANAKFVPVNT